jgi:hypothetical protein
MPSFLSTKRSRVITVAAAGTMTLVTAVSAAAATFPAHSSLASASAADVYLGSMSHGSATALKARPAVAPQQLLDFEQARSARQAREAKLASTRLTKADNAAAAQAAAQKRAEKAADAQATQQAQTDTATTTTTAAAPSGSAQQVAEQMLSGFAWSSSQFSCLDPLWAQESGWSVTAENPSSGAYGIPQALPGSKMASAGADWESDAATQIRWGLTYIQSLYGSPCGAWDHEEADGWY